MFTCLNWLTSTLVRSHFGGHYLVLVAFDNLRGYTFSMTWTILDTRRYIVSKNTCRVIIDHLLDCWMVLFPCLRFPVFGYFFICKTAKPPAATMRMSSCWHHRSSSLLASSLQCWRCRDLGRSPYCLWTNYFTSWYGRYPSIYRVSYMLAGCLGSLPSTVLGNFWRFCFFKIRFLRFVLGFQFWHGQTPP